MDKFFITIKRDGKRIDILEKLPAKLNTAGNLVEQAENFVNRKLDDLRVESGMRSQYSWKILRKQSGGYGMVTISKNWTGI